MKELVIDSGAAMTRALRVDDGVVTYCWLGTAPGDEQQANFVSIGDVFGARVVKIDRTLRIGFLQLGARPDDPGGVLRFGPCLLYTSPSPRDRQKSRMPSSA